MSSKLIEQDKTTRRFRFEVRGVVQGVGFRPFVYTIAKEFGLHGFVGNDGAGVFIEVEGDSDSIEAFSARLKGNPPPLAHIAEILRREMQSIGETSFRIVESIGDADDFTLVSPDIATCEDCTREFLDPADRRYHYPFINCTNCGPRFTITERTPYDRANTTMRDFRMCEECRAEYDDPLNRRFHAQPNACHVCGPQYCLIGNDGTTVDSVHAFAEARRRLHAGQILAVKGIGGFHLVCDARNAVAVARLRERKGRADKPFAVMTRNLTVADSLAFIGHSERAELLSVERPIVLLAGKSPEFGKEIAPNNDFIGIMLPYAPAHFLLFDETLDALVMTSGNLSNEPIVRDNIEAFQKLSPLCDGFLLHNRDIYVSCDDSVVRISNLGYRNADSSTLEAASSNSKSEVQIPIRRSRGFAPFPVELPFEVPPILAVGGELKATFCLTRGSFAFMSQHIGDMENLETMNAFERSVEQMKSLFGVEPEIVAGDLHPNYMSTNWAERRFATTKKFVKIQHHHAHIAAVMAENKVVDERVIGFAFDGTGYGTDGKIWGGEVLVAGYDGFKRAAQLEYFSLAGGDVSVRNIYRLGLSLLGESGVEWSEELPSVYSCEPTERKILQRQIDGKINVVETSSMGRLFDAVASIAGVRQKATYEAQAAIEFEAICDPRVDAAYTFDIVEGETLGIDYRSLVAELVADVAAHVEKSVVSAKFHNGVARIVFELSKRLRRSSGINKVALSGGCFQNVTLLEKTRRLLRSENFEILTHSKVPANDGGLALGQAVIAAVRNL